MIKALTLFFMIALPVFFLSFSPEKKHKIHISGTFVPKWKEMDNSISEFMTKWKIPGGSVALIKEDSIIYSRGFGMADDATPMMPDHLFRIASLSKPVTAVAIMKLVEEGKISLSQKVFGAEGILNDLKFLNIADSRIKNITVDQLLYHTAGWDRAGSCGDPMFDPVKIARIMKTKSPASSETVIRYMLTRPLDFDPGTHFAYSNFGYSILGRVIEKVSGESYEHFVKENILNPSRIYDMQMGRNLFCDKNCHEVKYYDCESRLVPSVCEEGVDCPFPYGGFNLEAMDAHGGWIASSSALAKFLIATDRKNENALLNKSINDIMLTPSLVNKKYAHGWCVNSNGNRWHTGSLVGASSMMAQISNGIGWVFLFNANPGTDAYFTELDRLMWNTMGAGNFKF